MCVCVCVCVCVVECDQEQQTLSTPTMSRLKGPDLKKIISAVIMFAKYRTTIIDTKVGADSFARNSYHNMVFVI